MKIAKRAQREQEKAQREQKNKELEEQVSYLTKKEANRDAEAGEPKVESKRPGFDFKSDTKTDG